MRTLKQNNLGLERQSLVYLILNLMLFVAKLSLGLLLHSFALMGDALNNLNDSLSSIVTWISLHIYAKPADSDHPYGHQRVDYIASTLLAIFILFTGFELMRSSIVRLIAGSSPDFSRYTLYVLCLSIFFKFYVYSSARKVAKNSQTLVFRAIATDALFDILISVTILIALSLEPFSSLSLDALCALGLSLLIIFQAIQLLRESFNQILGVVPDARVLAKIEQIYARSPLVIGTHDLVLHSYGRQNVFGIIHMEVDSSLDLVRLHDEVSRLEKNVMEETGVLLSTHIDPVELGDRRLIGLRQRVAEVCEAIDPDLEPHDFVLERRHGRYHLKFELKFPDRYVQNVSEILARIESDICATQDIDLKITIQPEFGYLPY